MKRFLMLLLCAVPLFCQAGYHDVEIDKENCTITKCNKTFPLYGRVEIVESYGDITVEIVKPGYFGDIKIKIVDESSFADSCGKIEIVDSYGDIKVEIVDSYGDIKVEIVDSFGGF